MINGLPAFDTSKTFWTGLHVHDATGNWTWADDRMTSWVAWAPGEPAYNSDAIGLLQFVSDYYYLTSQTNVPGIAQALPLCEWPIAKGS